MLPASQTLNLLYRIGMSQTFLTHRLFLLNSIIIKCNIWFVRYLRFYKALKDHFFSWKVAFLSSVVVWLAVVRRVAIRWSQVQVLH